MGILDDYLEISSLPDFHLRITQIFSYISLSQTFAFALVDTFLILYLLEFLTFSQLGIVLALKYALTSILDFPTGALGDFIGYSRVLRMAYGFLSLGALFLSLASSFGWIVFAYSFLAIGESQLSGALESWLDNRYKDDIVDQDKQIFGSFKGRLRGLTIVTNAIAIISGGIIAQLSSRRILIIAHLIMILVTLFLIIRFIPTTIKLEDNILRKVQSETYKTMKNSLQWLVGQPAILLLFIGFGVIYGVGGGVWYNQILFPYYFSYAQSDFNTGIIRSANFIIGFLWVLFVPRISKLIKDERLPLLASAAYANPIFFFFTWLYFLLFPPANTFVLVTFLGVIFLFQLVGIGDVLTEVFFSRIMIKQVPNDIRNSIYSLFSTIVTLFSIPFALIGGRIIDIYGFSTGIVFVSVSSFIGLFIALYGLMRYWEGNEVEDDIS